MKDKIINKVLAYKVDSKSFFGFKNEFLTTLSNEQLDFHKNLDKLLRRYKLSWHRLCGLTNEVNGLVAERFYKYLNNFIYYYDNATLDRFDSTLENNFEQKWYKVGAFPISDDEYILHLRMATKKGYETLIQYKFGKNDFNKGLYYLFMMGAAVSMMNYYLDHYHDHRVQYNILIKRFISSILKMDKDLVSHLEYKNMWLVLKGFYCLKGWDFWKHFLLGKEPAEIRKMKNI